MGRLEEAVREFDDVYIDDDAAFDTEDEATYVERQEQRRGGERRRELRRGGERWVCVVCCSVCVVCVVSGKREKYISAFTPSVCV